MPVGFGEGRQPRTVGSHPKPSGDREAERLAGAALAAGWPPPKREGQPTIAGPTLLARGRSQGGLNVF